MDMILLVDVETTMEKDSIMELMMGSWPFLLPIFILSVIGVYIFIERFVAIRKASKIDDNFMKNIRDYMLNGNIPAAESLCRSNTSPIARMIEKGIGKVGKPLKNIEVAVENVGKLEIFKMEKGLSTLATISGAAPMLGFLGTVTGMIKSFYNMASAGSNVDISVLSGGIYEALFTTAFGLAVGIVAYVGYNTLVTMVDSVVHKMEANSIDFIDLLQEPAS